jgi:hypothetical protein
MLPVEYWVLRKHFCVWLKSKHFRATWIMDCLVNGVYGSLGLAQFLTSRQLLNITTKTLNWKWRKSSWWSGKSFEVIIVVFQELQFTVYYVQTRPGYMVLHIWLAIVVTRTTLQLLYILRSFLVSIFTSLWNFAMVSYYADQSIHQG